MPSHDSLCLLRSVLTASRLTYLLRTIPCTGSPELMFDAILRESLSITLNIDTSDDRLAQASLPVRWGGLGIHSVVSLVPSASTWHQPRALRSSLRLYYLLDCMFSSIVASLQPCLVANQPVYHVNRSISTCLSQRVWDWDNQC